MYKFKIDDKVKIIKKEQENKYENGIAIITNIDTRNIDRPIIVNFNNPHADFPIAYNKKHLILIIKPRYQVFNI